MKRASLNLLAALLIATTCFAQSDTFRYIRIGNHNDVVRKPAFGIALMGGGKDLDDAFRWLCERANGGDFLILRAADDDAYNSYVNGLCKLNSVATLIIPDRDAAQAPAVADAIDKAEAVFIAGGDQAHYVRAWQNTPVQKALNAHIANGKSIGGTSAGLAILGEFAYGALNDPPDGMLASPEALKDPFAPQVALVRDFLSVPLLRNTITDSHFAKRDRLGRSLVFLARLMQDKWTDAPREIAVDEKSAVLVEPDGKSRVVGSGKGAYFISVHRAPEVCHQGLPLTFRDVAIHHATTGSEFDLKTWHGMPGADYSVSVVEGKLHSTQVNGQVY